MKLSIIILSGMLALGTTASAQKTMVKKVITKTDSTKVKKPIKKKKVIKQICVERDSSDVSILPVEPIKKRDARYCPNCGRG